MEKKNFAELTEGTQKAIEVAKVFGDKPFTYEDIKNASEDMVIYPGHLTSAAKAGYICTLEEKATLSSIAKRKLSAYTVITLEEIAGAKYSEKDSAALKAVKNFYEGRAEADKEKEFTIAEVSDFCGSKVPATSITNLVKKGNLKRLNGKVEVLVPATKEVSLYKNVD